YGPSISGDSVDYKNNVILTGQYRNKEYNKFRLDKFNFGISVISNKSTHTILTKTTFIFTLHSIPNTEPTLL
ncbi:MAG: hypothetical protein ACK559_18090, partial [bacterium]